MENAHFLLYLTAFWSLVFLLNFSLKKTFQRQYERYVQRGGVSINTCKVQWYTTTLNSTFLRLARFYPKLLDLWFDIGAIFSLLCGAASICFLAIIPVNTILRSQKAEDQILKPVIPGVNLPRSDVTYYLIALFVSAVLHEVGHAVAAVRSNVTVNGFGVFLMVIYPGAFVDLHTESLFASSPWKQLKIFCAGVWHNIVISAFGVILLFSLPIVLQPLYHINRNLVVVSHTENSMVAGPTGLVIGDVVTSVNRKPVNSISDWVTTLSNMLHSNATPSYRVPSYILDAAKYPSKISETDCSCDESELHICFGIVNNENSVHIKEPELKCLRAREIIAYEECETIQKRCLTPYIKHLSNYTRLLVLERIVGPPVIFFGHPVHLHQSLILGEVTPKWKFAPFYLPYSLENLCKYFISLSGALAILNVIPCYALDGQYIAKALIEITLGNLLPERREIIYVLTLLSGSALLFINIALAFFFLIFGK